MGMYIKATYVGHKQVMVHQPNGKRVMFVILDYKLVPGLWVNPLSIMSSLRRGWSISNKGVILTLSRQDQSVVFDQVLESSSGTITCIIMEPVLFPEFNVPIPTVQEAEAAFLDDLSDVEVVPDPEASAEPVPDAPPPANDPTTPPPVVTWDVNDLHNLLRYAHFDAIKRSAKYYNVKLSGTVKTSVACELAKIRQKNINKSPYQTASIQVLVFTSK
jgi:hypothetical protein